jgi:hypothetical protein
MARGGEAAIKSSKSAELVLELVLELALLGFNGIIDYKPIIISNREVMV